MQKNKPIQKHRFGRTCIDAKFTQFQKKKHAFMQKTCMDSEKNTLMQKNVQIPKNTH